MLKVSQLFIYPIKSLAGIWVDSAETTPTGFKLDRRFMLVDQGYRFLTLREFPKMARLLPRIEDGGLCIQSLEQPLEDLKINAHQMSGHQKRVVIWNSKIQAQVFSPTVNGWFSEALNAKVKLVYMPENSRRPIHTSSVKVPEGKIVSFADAYPFLMMGEASLEELNERYPGKQKFSINRFRPNIVFSGGYPNQEDNIVDFTINGVQFRGVEKCARCTVPNVNPKTGEMDNTSEPLSTLSKYRLQDGKVNFGVNLIHWGEGTIRVGDKLIPRILNQ